MKILPVAADVSPQHFALNHIRSYGVLITLLLLFSPFARAQTFDATLISSQVATQGQTMTYTAIVTNRTSNAVTGVLFSDTLDPNTTFVPGSLNTSPLAFADSFAALGNVQITIPAPALLTNDVDIDGVGPALTVTAAVTTSANGGNVTLTSGGGFTYNPPRGFEGVDTFAYQLNDGEGFADIGTVSISVTGMIWFVNAAAPTGGDGRLTSPLNSLPALAGINNGAGNNPAASDSIFIYSGGYTGPVALLNNQKLIGQGAGASLSAITGLTPPPGSLPLPATGGTRPIVTALGLASGNLLQGLDVGNGGVTGASVGPLTILEMTATNTAGAAVNLAGGALNVTLDSVTAAGGANGIRLVNCTGSFTVPGNGALAQNGTGGTIQNTTGNGVHLDNVTSISLARMSVNNCAANGVFGQNVNGLVLDWCSLTNNGDATGEGGIRFGDPLGANGFSGTARIANTLVRASGEMNIAVYNSAGTLAQLEVTNVISKDTRTRPLGADGFYFETRGNAVAAVNVSSCSFSNNFTQGIQASALGQSALTVNVSNCGFTNNNEGVVLANATDGDLTFDLNDNRFFNNLAAGASGSAIAAVNGTTVTPSSTYSGRIRNNTIIGGGIDNHLIAILFAGAGNNTLAATNNNINAINSQFSGLFLQAGETGSGNLTANVTVTGNTISLPSALASHGMAIQSRITSTLCAEIANNVSTTAGVGLFGINVRQRDTSIFRLPGYAGAPNDTAAVRAFLQGKNPVSTIGATVATGYSGGSPCALPPAAAPQPQFTPDLELEIVAVNGDPAAEESSESSPRPASITGGVADVNVAIGTLPARKSITITFRALVANSMPPGVCVLTNQAIITADGGISVITDDPRTPAPLDPTLTPVAIPPMVTTHPASNVTGDSATLNGAIHPCGSPTQCFFEYGTSTAYGNTTPAGALPAGLAEVPVSAPIAGLQPGTTYHFRLRGRNDFGTSNGADLTFTTTISIVQQPTNAAACVGGTGTFSVAASSLSVTYQWQRRLPGAAAFEDIAGATAATYTTPALTAADDGTAFRAVVSTPSTSVISAEAFISVIAIATPSVTYDFDSGLPPDTAIYGSAFISAGVLELNPNLDSQAGAFLTTDLAPGRTVRGFAATFNARLLAGTSPPADGFSFNWGTALPNGTYAVAEEGQPSGLSVAFDTFDNVGGEAPAVDVFWDGVLAAHKIASIPFLVRGSFVDVQIRLSVDGLLDVIYACEPVFIRLPVTGYGPQMGARFGLGSRTGGLWETHSIDDLALELYLDPEGNLPRITSIALSAPPAAQFKGTGAPNQNYSLEASTDLATWTWRATVLTDAGGLWQTTYPVFGEPYLFYRLKAAPQFPPGLVAWYKADDDFNDSFGPNHGEPEGATAFGMGQRGQAFSLNGKDEAILIKSDGPIRVPWTAAFWVNREDSPDVSAALISDGVSAIKLEQWPSSRQVGITQFGVADYSYAYIAPAGGWVHLTFVGTRSGTALYVDGRFSETIPAVLDLPFEFIGRRETGQDRLRGLLDEITIFNRELTPAEIQELRNTTRGP